ncbi:MAG: phosphoglucosamine mutase [Planctomycetota bacterium]
MTRRLFGTDGVRGVANEGDLTPERLLLLGRAIGQVLADSLPLLHQETKVRLPRPAARQAVRGTARVLVGRDTRLSGPFVRDALLAGILSRGIGVVDGGVLPTPVVAHLARRERFDVGIVISASHNPMEDNGVKLFSSSGLKIPDAAERAIEELVEHPPETWDARTGDALGDHSVWPEAADSYVEDVVARYKDRLSLAGRKVVVDCANGATHGIAPRVLGALGAAIVPLNIAPDGTNINRRCGALHPQVVAKAVRAEKACLGLSFDGDGDRLIAVDERGRVRDGDFLLAMLGLDLKATARLPGDTIVSTVMANIGLDLCLEAAGVRLLRAPVGDRNVLAEMLSGGYRLGGEQSGHVIFLDESTTGDAIITALRVLEVVVRTGRSLGDLTSTMRKYPQVLLNVRVKSKPPLETVPRVQDEVRAVEEHLAGKGRLLLRYSGTEALARVMVEGPNKAEITRDAKRIAEVIERELG